MRAWRPGPSDRTSPARRSRAPTARPGTSTCSTSARAIENQVVWVSHQPDRPPGRRCASSGAPRSSTPMARCRAHAGAQGLAVAGRSIPAAIAASRARSSTTWATAGRRRTACPARWRSTVARRPTDPAADTAGARGHADRVGRGQHRCADIVPCTARADPCAELERDARARSPTAGPTTAAAVQARTDAWLGHRRLSIVDLERRPPAAARPTAAPTWSATARSTTTRRSGRTSASADSSRRTPTTRWRCTCSTSTGPRRSARLNGMFAFVMAGRDGRFVAARDPVGIKPLYWAHARRAPCASPPRCTPSTARAGAPTSSRSRPAAPGRPSGGLVRFALGRSPSARRRPARADLGRGHPRRARRRRSSAR